MPDADTSVLDISFSRLASIKFPSQYYPAIAQHELREDDIMPEYVGQKYIASNRKVWISQDIF